MLEISFVLWVWSAVQFAVTVRVVPELGYNLKDIVIWGRNWHDDSNAVKAQPSLYNGSNNSGAIDVKTMGRILIKSYLSLSRIDSRIISHFFIELGLLIASI